MEFISAAPPPSSPHPAASPRMMKLCRNSAGVRRRRWLSSQKMGKLKLAAAAGSQVSPAPVRRSQRLVAAAEPSGVQIPASPPRQAKRPRSRRLYSRRIQSRGSNRRPSSAAQKKKNAPYFWGARRARSALTGGGDDSNPALSPTIQSRGEKRRFYFCASSSSPAWGAKRARSAICCGGGDVDPVDPVPAHVDWANLGDGPAGLIAEFALANDVADYVRFRAVCHPWRRCSPDPRAGGLDGRFLPRRWIMIDKAISASPRCHRFLNISTGECIRMGLPELDEHTLLALTPEGLLLLLHAPTLIVRLLNPLTRKLIDLPPVTTLLTEHMRAKRPHIELDLAEVYGVGLAGASTVVVCFSYPKALAVAKPGDECWTVVYNGHLHSALPFAGRFYCCVGKRVMVLDITSSDQQPPQLLAAADPGSLFYFSQMAHSLHLVDNAGELMLVHRSLYHDHEYNHKRKYNVYRVDLDVGTLVPVKGFNGRAIFMGWDRTVSVAAEAFPSITSDTIYLGSDLDRSRRIDSYLSIEMQPCSVIDCLSHCIQGIGKELV